MVLRCLRIGRGPRPLEEELRSRRRVAVSCAGRVRRDRHECQPVRLQRPLVDGRSRHDVFRWRVSGRRPRVCRPHLYRRPSGPTRSHRADPRARGSYRSGALLRRGSRRSDLCHAVHGRTGPPQARRSRTTRGRGRPCRRRRRPAAAARAIRDRIYSARTFHRGRKCAPDRYAAWAGLPYGRLEAGRRSDHRRAGNGRRAACHRRRRCRCARL